MPLGDYYVMILTIGLNCAQWIQEDLEVAEEAQLNILWKIKLWIRLLKR